ncbi:hypothetical protein JCM3774_005951 [Rhodotorula dairenensis]
MPGSRSTITHGTYTVPQSGPTLAYSLHQPTTPAQPTATRAALIAHPYGRLGGCKDDHVVVSLVESLAANGWTVLRYDARGSGSSTGSVSWTGRAEAHDYAFILRDVLLPIVLPPDAAGTPQTVSLLLAGYSYGSLAASACPPPDKIGDVRFETSYLLISYPLSVAWALCALQTAFFTSALSTRTLDHRVLAVYGDQDQFTAIAKFRQWATDLGQQFDLFRSIEIAGADHFWRQRDSKRQLLSTICAWLSRDGEAC